MSIDNVWDRIIRYEGDLFHTVRGLPFTYKVVRNAIITDRTNRSLTKSNIEKALQYLPVKNPGQITNAVQGSSYVYALLTDVRIIGGHSTSK